MRFGNYDFDHSTRTGSKQCVAMITTGNMLCPVKLKLACHCVAAEEKQNLRKCGEIINGQNLAQVEGLLGNYTYLQTGD